MRGLIALVLTSLVLGACAAAIGTSQPQLVFDLASARVNQATVQSYPVTGKCWHMRETRTIELRVGQTLVGTATCSDQSFWASVDFRPFPDGPVTLEASATNTPPTSQVYVKDTAAPQLKLETLSSLTSPQAIFSATDSDIASYECSVNNSRFKVCTSPLALSLAEDEQGSISVRAVDKAGNRSAVVSKTYKQGMLPGGFNGPVRAVLPLSNGNVLVGGAFDRFGGSYPAPYLAVVRQADGSPRSSLMQQIAQGAGGPVLRVLQLSTGNILIGGYFQSYQGVAVRGLALLDPQGNLLSSFLGANEGFAGIVEALAEFNGQIVVGGVFSQFVKSSTTTPISNLAVLDLNGNLQSGLLGAGDGLKASGGNLPYCLSLLADGNTLYVGGGFDSYTKGGASTTVRGLVALDTSLNLVTSFLPADEGFTAYFGFTSQRGMVYDLAKWGSNLIVGGSFTSYRRGGVDNPVKHLVALDPTTGALQTSFLSGSDGFNNQVNTLLVDGLSLLVGGLFSAHTKSGVTTTVNRLARVDASGTLDASFVASGQGFQNSGTSAPSVQRILKVGASYWVGGLFSSYDTQKVQHLAVLNLSGHLVTALSAVGDGFSDEVDNLVAIGDDVFVSGKFTSFQRGGTAVSGLALLDPDGNLVSSFLGSGEGFAFSGKGASVNAILPDGNDFIVGGDFNQFTKAGVTKNIYRLAKLDASGNLVTSFLDNGEGVGADQPTASLAVEALASYQGKIAVGGKFNSYVHGGVTTNFNYLCLVDPMSGAADSSFLAGGSDGFDYTVYALSVVGTDLVAGGAFYGFQQGATWYDLIGLGRVDSTGHLVTSFAGQNEGVNDEVYALAPTPAGDAVFVGGSFGFFNRGSIGQKRLTKVFSSGAADTSFVPSAGGFNANVDALALDGTKLLVGGAFSGYSKPSATTPGSLALLDAAGNLDPSFWGSSDSLPYVFALAVQGESVFVGGNPGIAFKSGSPFSFMGLRKLNLSDGTPDERFLGQQR